MTSKRIVELKKEKHNGKIVLMIRFPFDREIWNIIKLKSDSKWSQTKKGWYVPWSDNAISEVKSLLISINDNQETIINSQNEISFTIIGGQALNPLISEKLEKYKRWMLSRRYSSNTIKTYSDSLKVFFSYYNNKTIDTINNQDVIDFNNDYILNKNLSASYQNQFVNALKLFYRKIEDRIIDPELIHRPKRPHVLPNILSKEEVKKLLDSTQNLKHKAMLSITYACGLRCGEVLHLKPQDINTKRGLLIIKQSKGRKDRVAPISSKIILLLRSYFLAFKPKVYLFEGQNSGEPYDERSFQNVLKQNVAKAGIKKPVTLHWLRHSYATHLLESGTDLRYIQEILGHNSSRTTEIYTHVSRKSLQNISSPFDDL